MSNPALQLPAAPAATHPMNSSRLLWQLLSLESPDKSGQGWDAIIHRSVMRQLMLALQYRDPQLVRHSRQVATLAVSVAQHQLGWEGQELFLLEAACLLHDVGKIGIPDIILFKPGQLAPEEAELMSLLYRITGDILQACRANQQIVEIITQSQNHYGAASDLSGVGSEMHQGARILAVVDAYDSLVNQQSFRDAHSHEKAMDILARGAGSRFDGNVVSALTRWFEANPAVRTEKSEVQPYQLSAEEVLEAGSLSHMFSYLYLVESLYHGFYMIDTQLRPIVWNTGCERLTGIPWQKALAEPAITSLIEYQTRHGQPMSHTDLPIFTAAETGRPMTTELQLKVGEKWAPVEIQTIPIPDADGQILGFAEIFRNLSDEVETGTYRDLRMMATRDALTHVANRGELHNQLNRQFKQYIDTGRKDPFSIIFLDVDHFKRANDTYGHAAGDEVLVNLARLLQDETYSGELIARFGGEEFVILCPETRLDDAWQRAERLRNVIAKAQIVASDEFRITSSFGVSEVEPHDTAESVLERADKALYMSKHSGRNRTSKLTSAQLKAADPSMVMPPEEKPDAFKFEHKLRACVTADMIIYKLSAFVDAHKAKLVDVQEDKVTMKVGQKGLLPGWGSKPERQPLDVILEFGDERSTVERGASKLVEINVTMTPIGKAKKADTFEKRARGVLKDLREYLAAEHDEELV